MSCPSDVNSGLKGSPESGPGQELVYATGSYRAVSGRSDGLSRPEGGSWFDVKNGWGGFHDQAFHAVLCDGAVRTISQSIDMDVFGAVATIAGGEAAQLP